VRSIDATTATALASYMGGLLAWGIGEHGQSEAFWGEDDGPRRSEQLGQQVGEAHAAALGGARDAGQYLVGVRAGLRAVARGHLAHDDRRPDLALREAVGGRYRGVAQEDEDLVLVLPEVLAESPVARVLLLRVEEAGELLLRVAHSPLPEALAPHLDREFASPTELDGLFQEVLHRLRELGGLTALSLEHLGAATEQVRVALGERTAEGRVHGPAVDHQDAGEKTRIEDVRQFQTVLPVYHGNRIIHLLAFAATARISLIPAATKSETK